jgi:rod shape-determining protein MreD
VTLPEAVKAGAGLVFLALFQITIVTPIGVAGGHADLVLVFLVSLALVRGPLVGAAAGFWAGLLLDAATFGTLGLSSLVLTLAGYWAGRFGVLTTRSSPHPPLIAVALATVWVAVGTGLLEFLLGQGAPASELLGRVLLPTLALNLALTVPVYRLTCRLFPPSVRERREAPALG